MNSLHKKREEIEKEFTRVNLNPLQAERLNPPVLNSRQNQKRQKAKTSKHNMNTENQMPIN